MSGSSLIVFGKTILVIGCVLLVIGVIFLAVGKFGGSLPRLPLGRLPGDIRVESTNFSCFFPIVSMILLSIVLSIVLNIILRLLNH